MGLLLFGVVLADQLAKFYIQETMTLGMSVPIFAEILHITYILNPGAAFGILENQRVFFIVIAVSMLAALVYFYPRLAAYPIQARAGTALLAGGAAGNLIDRMQTGSVVDFIDFRFWPIFNIADIAIVCGVGAILYALLFLPQMKDEQDECK